MAQMWIDNRWTGAADGRVFEVRNPATEEVLDTAPRAAAADVDRAVAGGQARLPRLAAHARHREGARSSTTRRRRIREDREGLAILLTREGGKPLPENRDEIEWIAACFDYYAEIGRDVVGRVISPVARNQFNFVVKEPYGVAGLIVPWNYPLLLLSWKLAPALAAGNTVVAKPSELTPLSTLRLMRAFEELPDGRRERGHRLRRRGRRAPRGPSRRRGRGLHREPGHRPQGRGRPAPSSSRSATSSWAATIPSSWTRASTSTWPRRARPGPASSTWARSAPRPSASSWSGKAFDEFVDRFVAYTKTLRIGDPLGPDVDLGPMISAAQREKVERKVAEALAGGAQRARGGQAARALRARASSTSPPPSWT